MPKAASYNGLSDKVSAFQVGLVEENEEISKGNRNDYEFFGKKLIICKQFLLGYLLFFIFFFMILQQQENLECLRLF